MLKKNLVLLAGTILITCITAMTACAPSQKELTPKDMLDQQIAMPQKGEQIAVMTTNLGVIKLKFFPQYAPKAVENFLTHSKNGYYDGVIFHRVAKDFVIQGGDPTGTGTGGESIWGEDFDIEVTPALHHLNGALCMAKTMQPVSNGSQFYIVSSPALPEDMAAAVAEMKNHLDEPLGESEEILRDYFSPEVLDYYLENGGVPMLDFGYTVFGQVIEGLDIVNQISNVETEGERPVEDVIIEKIEVTEY